MLLVDEFQRFFSTCILQDQDIRGAGQYTLTTLEAADLLFLLTQCFPNQLNQPAEIDLAEICQIMVFAEPRG